MKCSFDGCDRRLQRYGLCHGHVEQQRLGKSLKPLRNYGPLTLAQFMARVAKSDGCWEWLDRRPRYGLCRNRPAHRVSWGLHFGTIPDGMNVLHRCDNPPCVRPDHLFLGTQADNIRDMMAKKRDRKNPQRGEANHAAKLTEHDIVDIRSLYAFGANQYDLAEQFGVAQGVISSIHRRTSWKHVA